MKTIISAVAFCLALFISSCFIACSTETPQANDGSLTPAINEPEKDGDETMDTIKNIDKNTNEGGLVIKSENPVMTDKDTILNEFEKEVTELLKSLGGIDTVEDRDLEPLP